MTRGCYCVSVSGELVGRQLQQLTLCKQAETQQQCNIMVFAAAIRLAATEPGQQTHDM
jgi:hypothetical protein